MIRVKIFGGLGNQMFQYAFGKAVAQANNYEVEFIYDNSSYERELGLNYFNIQTLISYKKWEYPLIYKLLAKINKFTAFKLYPYNNQKYIYDYKLNFDGALLEVKDNSFLEGYWQSEKYFKSIENIIREEFEIISPINEKSLEAINSINKTNSVSIHFRRGDYISDENAKKTHGMCSEEYYKKSIAFIKEKISDPHFFIFSDDINWVKNNFKFSENATFIDFTTLPIDDLRLMSLCNHNIMANSTFSWWAAWLNCNKDKIVISPKKWFLNSRDDSDLLIEGWIKL